MLMIEIITILYVYAQLEEEEEEEGANYSIVGAAQCVLHRFVVFFTRH